MCVHIIRNFAPTKLPAIQHQLSDKVTDHENLYDYRSQF